MKVQLVFEKGRRRKVLTLTTPRAIIGRAHGTTVRMPSSEVSRQHCRLTLEEGLVRVVDLGSVNGTFLNGQRITAATVVRPGDRLEVGPVAFTVEYGLTSRAQRKLQQEEEP